MGSGTSSFPKSPSVLLLSRASSPQIVLQGSTLPANLSSKTWQPPAELFFPPTRWMIKHCDDLMCSAFDSCRQGQSCWTRFPRFCRYSCASGNTVLGLAGRFTWMCFGSERLPTIYSQKLLISFQNFACMHGYSRNDSEALTESLMLLLCFMTPAMLAAWTGQCGCPSTIAIGGKCKTVGEILAGGVL